MKTTLLSLLTVGLLVSSLDGIGATKRPVTPTALPLLTNLAALSKFKGRPSVVVTPLPPGQPPDPTTASASLIRFGNYIWPGFPENQPILKQVDLLARNPLFVDTDRRLTASPIGQYKFKPRQGARQVIWIADVLIEGGLQFTVDGFPWGMSSDENHPPQSLTVQGISGKVFVSSDQNFGGYTLTIRK